MKKLMSVTVIALAGWAIANANEVETVQENTVVSSEIQLVVTQQDSVKKTLVQPENLPDGVKKTLSGEEYADWVIVLAYHVEPEGKEAYYKISLEKEGEEDLKIVKMDAEGKLKEREATPSILP